MADIGRPDNGAGEWSGCSDKVVEVEEEEEEEEEDEEVAAFPGAPLTSCVTSGREVERRRFGRE